MKKKKKKNFMKIPERVHSGHEIISAYQHENLKIVLLLLHDFLNLLQKEHV